MKRNILKNITKLVIVVIVMITVTYIAYLTYNKNGQCEFEIKITPMINMNIKIKSRLMSDYN